jgi:prepilin-type N-terminal cleavage/methylation domain-containing protein
MIHAAVFLVFPGVTSMGRSKIRTTAFTLVELLVVVAIIAMLLAMLLPVFENARYQVRITTCAANLRQISIASLTYTTDHRGWYPGAGNGGYPNGVLVKTTEVPPGLAPYCGGEITARQSELWRCPEAYRRTQRFGENPDNFGYYAVYYNKISAVYSRFDEITYSLPQILSEGFDPECSEGSHAKIGRSPHLRRTARPASGMGVAHHRV